MSSISHVRCCHLSWGMFRIRVKTGHSHGRPEKESFNQVVTPMAYPLLYSPLWTGMPMSKREDGDARMSPMPE
jgi:hypothetical protein